MAKSSSAKLGESLHNITDLFVPVLLDFTENNASLYHYQTDLCRNRLSYEQFSAFLTNIKDLNAHKQSREVRIQYMLVEFV